MISGHHTALSRYQSPPIADFRPISHSGPTLFSHSLALKHVKGIGGCVRPWLTLTVPRKPRAPHYGCAPAVFAICFLSNAYAKLPRILSNEQRYKGYFFAGAAFLHISEPDGDARGDIVFQMDPTRQRLRWDAAEREVHKIQFNRLLGQKSEKNNVCMPTGGFGAMRNQDSRVGICRTLTGGYGETRRKMLKRKVRFRQERVPKNNGEGETRCL